MINLSITKGFLAFACLLCFADITYSQKIQYSRTMVGIPNTDEMQLVADVGGNHHLVSVGYNRKVSIYIYNPQLILAGKKTIGLTMKNAADLKAIKFSGYYLLYHHVVNSRQHQIWSISSNGLITDMSAKFQTIVDSVLSNSSSTLLLLNKSERLYAVGHVYYDSLKTIKTTIVQLDSNFEVVSVHKIFFPFYRESEYLHQVEIAGDHMLILKTVRDNEKGNSLDLVKANFLTGRMQVASFNSGAHLHVGAGMLLNRKDSGVLIYSMLRGPLQSSGRQRSVFVTTVDKDLKEQTMATVLNSPLRGGAISSFLLAGNQPMAWLKMQSFERINRYSNNNFLVPNVREMYSYGNQDFRTGVYGQTYSIRFSILNTKLEVSSDTLVANNKNLIEVQPFPYAQVVVKDKSYLIFTQNYTLKKRALWVISAKQNKGFATVNLPVYDRYTYLLSLLQNVNEEYLLIPFVNKNDVGLVKVSTGLINDQP